MDLKYLKTLKTVVDEGSFSKAAAKLSYTQSTITFQIQQLEKQLSVQLFEKIGRKMVLTKAGENLLPYINNVFVSVEKLMQADKNTEFTGDLHIATAETFMCYKMPSVLKKFHKIAPNVRLFLHSMNCYKIKEELISGNLDIGIFYKEIGISNYPFIVQEIGEYPLVLVSSYETRKQYPDFIKKNQTFEIPLVIDEPDCIFRQIFESYLKKKNITLGHTIELWSIPTIKNLIKNNVGISFLPLYTVTEELEKEELCTIKTGLDGSKITAVCAHHKNKWISPTMQLFIDLLASCD